MVSGTNTKFASVTVGTDGTTYFGDSFSGPLDIDPLGAGDVRMAADSGLTTLVWRTRADGTRDWIPHDRRLRLQQDVHQLEGE